jgi:hypothetical protein
MMESTDLGKCDDLASGRRLDRAGIRTVFIQRRVRSAPMIQLNNPTHTIPNLEKFFAAEQDRDDVAAAREALRKAQPALDPKRLTFIDETAATTKMTRLYGRAPQGERLVDKVPHGHWKTTTFICGLRYNGVTATVYAGWRHGRPPLFSLRRTNTRPDFEEGRHRIHG